MEIAIAFVCFCVVLLAYLIVDGADIAIKDIKVKDIFILFYVFVFLFLITNWFFMDVKTDNKSSISKEEAKARKELMEIIKNIGNGN